VKRLPRNSEKKMTTTIEDLTEQFANNFNLLHSKERKGWKCNATCKEETMTNGVILNVLSDEETEDANSFNEKDEKEILVMIDKDIQEFKDKHMMY
jgi:hypothetical protein